MLWAVDYRIKRITAAVIFAHSFFILLLCLSWWRSPDVSPRKKRICVQSVALKNEKKNIFVAAATEEKIDSEQKNGKELQKTSTHSPEVKKQSLQKEKTAPKKIEPKEKSREKGPSQKRIQEKPSEKKDLKRQSRELTKKKQALLTEIQKRMQGVKAVDTAELASLPAVTQNPQISSDQQVYFTQESDYTDELASLFKMLLCLPEEGEVRVKLSLKRTGDLVKIEVVSAKSSKNRSYVEKMLKTLSFPAFGKHFAGEAQHTFFITLTS